ncbi:MAG: MarR family transcriptional regulator [Rhizobiaceae bacterium]|nr:MarR family transcriptional regulator [Rhizobiaceae bacterium]
MSRQLDQDSFGFLVNDVARMVRAEVDRRTAEAGLGLTQGEGRALIHAKRAGPVRQNLLAERLGVEAMTLSGTLDRLEAKGLVERRADPADRRAKLVHLTDAGEEMIGSVAEIGAAIREDASCGLDPADWTRFLLTLKRVRDNLTAQRAEQGVAA